MAQGLAPRDINEIDPYEFAGIVRCLREGIFGPLADATSAFMTMQLKEGTKIEQVFKWMEPLVTPARAAALIEKHRNG